MGMASVVGDGFVVGGREGFRLAFGMWIEAVGVGVGESGVYLGGFVKFLQHGCFG